jgi:hypothetical protein
MRPDPEQPNPAENAGFDPTPFRDMGEPEGSGWTGPGGRPSAFERVQAIQRRNRVGSARLALVLGAVGFVLGAMALSTLLGPPGALPESFQKAAAELDPAVRRGIGLAAGAVEALLGLGGLGIGLRIATGEPGVTRILGRIACVMNLLVLGAAVALFVLS